MISLTITLSYVVGLSAETLVEQATKGDSYIFDPWVRTAWASTFGYILREKWPDPRVKAFIGATLLQHTTNSEQVEKLRQEMLNNEEAIDRAEDGPLRADSRRAMIEYYKCRSGRYTTMQNIIFPCIFHDDALVTLTATGIWAGPSYEIGTLVFPDLKKRYCPLHMVSRVATLVDAISKITFDQRFGVKIGLISAYEHHGGNLNRDLRDLHAFVSSCTGSEASLIGHYVAIANLHPENLMLACCLAALRLRSISLRAMNFPETWLRDANWIAKRIKTPANCLTASDLERETRTRIAVGDIWKYINADNSQCTDGTIFWAQEALRKLVNEELHAIHQGNADPAVLWSVCAALFFNLANIPDLGTLLLLGDKFRNLFARLEEKDEPWRCDIQWKDGDLKMTEGEN